MTPLRQHGWQQTGLLPLLLLALLSLTAPRALAATYYIATTGSDATGDGSQANPFQTVGKGIAVAAAGDTVLIADGTYSGAGNRDLDFGGKDIVVRSASDNPAQCILDCQSAGRAFLFWNSETSAAVVRGLTIKNGVLLFGGAIFCDNGSNPSISNCVFTANLSNLGGALFFRFSNPTVASCVFVGNSAGGGGAIYNNRSDPTITNCTFSGNMAIADIGGAVYNNFSNAVITNCIFAGNSAYLDAGAMHNNNNKPIVTNCAFVGNSAGGDGGAVYVFADIDPGLATFTNCTFSGNQAAGSAGAFFVNSASPVITNSIFWGDVGQGGEFGALSGSALLSNSIVQGGLPSFAADGGGNLTSDPLFLRNPFSNGASDFGNLHLQPGSPALDAGNDAVVTVPPFPADAGGTPLDLDGAPRIIGTHVDLGAYEFADTTPPVITTPASPLIAYATSAAGAVVPFSVTATDDVDGSVPVVCNPPSSSVFPPGKTTVTCTAQDAAGNTATKTFVIWVQYAWSGVLQPLNVDGSSVFKAGSTVPIKFQLTGASAGITNLQATLSYQKISNGDPGTVNEATLTSSATSGNLFRYDASSGQYIFNWSTKGLATGKYRLTIDLGDGVIRTVDLGLK